MFTSLHSCRLYKEWNSIVRSDGQGKKTAVGTKHSCYAGKLNICIPYTSVGFATTIGRVHSVDNHKVELLMPSFL